MFTDLVQGHADDAIEDEGDVSLAGELRQGLAQLPEPLFGIELGLGAGFSALLKLSEDIRDVQCLRYRGLSRAMLMQDGLRHGVQVRFGRAYGFGVPYTDQPQEDLLHQVGHVGDGMAQSCLDESPQLSIVLCDEGRDEGVFLFSVQSAYLAQIALPHSE